MWHVLRMSSPAGIGHERRNSFTVGEYTWREGEKHWCFLPREEQPNVCVGPHPPREKVSAKIKPKEKLLFIIDTRQNLLSEPNKQLNLSMCCACVWEVS